MYISIVHIQHYVFTPSEIEVTLEVYSHVFGLLEQWLPGIKIKNEVAHYIYAQEGSSAFEQPNGSSGWPHHEVWIPGAEEAWFPVD